MVDAVVARELWTLFEPVHAVTYFTPEAVAAYEEAGLRGYWRGYFAGRAAALGPVGPEPVVAAFFGFAPAMVARAFPDVWTRAAPDAVLDARLRGAVAALRRLAGGADVTEAADLLHAAASSVDLAGRVLGAAHAALPVPDDAFGRLWRAATVLREHRGDGHVAALVAADVDGPESLVWRAGLDLAREALQPYRGWTDEEWDAAVDRLRSRGWLDASGRVTDAGREAQRAVEAATDAAAARPWRALGEERVARLRAALAPVSAAAYAVLPPVTPLGLPPRR
ncbi:MAG TPA: hypothetical protein VFQ85_13690 [Mycobacteriales bacterium]|nr:hypothetical protein [Mycobacteriales bacterium]